MCSTFLIGYRRNQNFLDILNGLNLGQKGVFGITHQFHHVFWFGDLNYRIELEVQVRAIHSLVHVLKSIVCETTDIQLFSKCITPGNAKPI